MMPKCKRFINFVPEGREARIEIIRNTMKKSVIFLLVLALAGSGALRAQGHVGPFSGKPEAGSGALRAQGHVGPFSGEPEAGSIRTVCDTVAGWQIRHFAECRHKEMSWTNGALYLGMFEWAYRTESERIFSFLKGIGKKNRWALPLRAYHADDICAGQTLIKLYKKYKDPAMLQNTLERAFYVASHPSTAPLSKKDKVGKNTRWSWCDALFMAPPVYAALYTLTGEQVFADYLEAEFHEATDSLYDREAHLYYRDCMRIPKREKNGAKQFWGRGDGWVFAGIPQVLENLPADYPGRAYYEQIFREMAGAVLATQDRQGHWHASLLDPDSYPDPENSASAFFCYGLGWGLRTGLLKGEEYEKALLRGWAALVEAVHPDGLLGYIQPVGADPRPAGPDSTDVYGVGAFLLAGSEMLRLYGN